MKNTKNPSKGNFEVTFWGKLLFSIMNKSHLSIIAFVTSTLIFGNMITSPITTDKKIFISVLYATGVLWYLVEDFRSILRVIFSLVLTISFGSIASVQINEIYPNSLIVNFASMLFVYFAMVTVSEVIKKKTNYIIITVLSLVFIGLVSTIFISSNINPKYIILVSMIYVAVFTLILKLQKR